MRGRGANTVTAKDGAFLLHGRLTGTYLVAAKTQTYKNAHTRANRDRFS